MPNFEASAEEVLGLIAKNAIIISRQDKALSELSDAYSAKLIECERLQTEINELKTQKEFPKEVTG